MRTFIAIDFGRELKAQIVKLQSVLKTHANCGRWKYEDNFHLTLKFLGEISPVKASEVVDMLKPACNRLKSFKLGISGVGYFPGNGCMRVVWLGVGGELKRLADMQSEIDSELSTLGFEREKRVYTPHVTIGQDVVFRESFEKIKRLFDFDVFPEVAVNSIYLFKSEQTGYKRIYTRLNCFKLDER